MLTSFKQEKCYNKWYLSENFAFQNLLKNKQILLAEKFGNILAFDKKSERKSNYLYRQTISLKIIYL